MAKLNKSYTSFFEFLSSVRFPFARALDKELYRAERRALEKTRHRRHDPNRSKSFFVNQMKGAFQPFADSWKDFIDTFKPYKSWRAYAFFDTLQLFKGLGNIARGLVSIVGAPVYFVGATIVNIRNSVKSSGYSDIDGDSHRFWPTLGLDLTVATSWLIEGVGSVLRGAAQIFTAPLALVRIPFRLGLTAIRTAIWGSQKVEENKGIQKLFDQERRTTKAEVKLSIAYDLHRKFEKALHRYQPTELDREIEKLNFSTVQWSPDPAQPPSPTEYLSFFQNSVSQRKERLAQDMRLSEEETLVYM